MPAYKNVNEALGALDAKLDTLKTMAEANGFLVAALKNDATALREMDEEGSRAMLRARARAVYAPGTGSAPNPEVLALLEEILGRGKSAEIIRFPVRRK